MFEFKNKYNKLKIEDNFCDNTENWDLVKFKYVRIKRKRFSCNQEERDLL